jgi:predicted PurR-regulated permease PerM
VTIVSVLAGAELLGILGALLAIPMAAAIQIVVRDWWTNRGHEAATAAEQGATMDVVTGEATAAAP